MVVITPLSEPHQHSATVLCCIHHVSYHPDYPHSADGVTGQVRPRLDDKQQDCL